MSFVYRIKFVWGMSAASQGCGMTGSGRMCGRSAVQHKVLWDARAFTSVGCPHDTPSNGDGWPETHGTEVPCREETKITRILLSIVRNTQNVASGARSRREYQCSDIARSELSQCAGSSGSPQTQIYAVAPFIAVALLFTATGWVFHRVTSLGWVIAQNRESKVTCSVQFAGCDIRSAWSHALGKSKVIQE